MTRSSSSSSILASTSTSSSSISSSSSSTSTSSTSSISSSTAECEWIQAFNNKLKVRSFEQFSLLLFDKDAVSNDNSEQRQLLRKVLFENHQSASYWYDYISHVIIKFPGRKLQLQRLINKALDCVTDGNAKENRTNRHFVSLYLLSAQYKNDDKECMKYFDDIIWKKEIGRRFANVFISWSEVAMRLNGHSEAIAIIQKGIDCQAEPRHMLQTKLQELQSFHTSSKAVTHFDDGEVVFNKNSKKKDINDPNIEEVTVTMEQPTIEIKTDMQLQLKPAQSSKQSFNFSNKPKTTLLARSKTNNSLLSSLGKCQRVTVANKDTKNAAISDDSDDDDSNNQSLADVISFKQPFSSMSIENNPVTISRTNQSIDDEIVFKKNNIRPESDEEVTSCGMTATVKLDPTEPKPLAIGKRKADLSKYIDDKLLNFDPNKRLSKNVTNEPPSIPIEAKLIVSNKNVVDDKENRMTRSSTRTCEKRPNPSTENTGSGPSVEVGVTDKRKRVSFAQGGEAGLPLSATEIALAEKQKEDVKKKAEIKKKDIVIKTSSSESKQLDLTSRIILNGRSYTRLGVLGKGGSSCVYRVLSDDGNLYAYKYVDVRGDSDSVFENYTNEIELLRRLKGSPYIIELIDAEVNKDQMYIAMILEIGDIDLAKSLSQKQKVAAMSSSTNLNPFYIRLVWQEMLEAVDHIHENRIVHGDLKPANFVFVKGHLKLIDFGIAKAFSNDTTNIYRESQIGTVNYMAPEAIAPYTDESEDSNLRMKLGRASDIWSLGCILYQMIYGRPPFAALNTIQKLHAIPNPKNEIKYPPYDDLHAIETMKACLERDPKRRAKIRGKNGLLEYPFLRLNQIDASVISLKSNKVLDKMPISELTVDGTTEIMEIDTPLVAIDDVRKVVQFVMDTVNVKKFPKEIDKEKLDDIVWKFLTHRDDKLEYHKQLLMAIDEADNKLHAKSPSGSVQNMKDDVKEIRQPLKVLPNNLMDQIKQSSKALESNEKSTRAQKWMKPKDNSPEKQDMRSILERRIADMRKFMEVESEETNTTFFN